MSTDVQAWYGIADTMHEPGAYRAQDFLCDSKIDYLHVLSHRLH